MLKTCFIAHKCQCVTNLNLVISFFANLKFKLVRQEFFDICHKDIFKFRLGAVYFEVPKLTYKLSAGATRRRVALLLVADDGYRRKGVARGAFADSLGEGGAFGADSHRVCGIFDVAAPVGRAVLAKDGRTHLEFAVGAVGALAAGDGELEGGLSGGVWGVLHNLYF